MAGPVPLVREGAYDIFIEDADGRRLCLEILRDLADAGERLRALAALYPQMRLVLRCQKTRAILAETEGY